MKKYLSTAGAAALASMLALAGSAHATLVDFAEVSGANLSWSQSAGTLKEVNAPGKGYDLIGFKFDTTALQGLGTLTAGLVFSGTATSNAITAAGLGGTEVGQPLLSGSFTITYQGAANTTIGALTIHPGDTLLTGAFTGGDLGGLVGQKQAAFELDSGALAPLLGSVTFTSPYETFGNANETAISLASSGINNKLVYSANHKLNSFTGTFSGNFAADPGPTAAIPEPASWAMMLVGFGAVGAFARRRKLAAAA